MKIVYNPQNLKKQGYNHCNYWIIGIENKFIKNKISRI